jgi:hypothetical protein
MRWIVCALLVAGCMADEPAGPELPPPIDTVWAQTIHPGDMFVLVPGTGGYDYIATQVDPLPDPATVDVHTNTSIANDAVVFEQAIASAHRAGIANEMLEDGTITFAIWGIGLTVPRTSFTYVSWEGLHVPIQVLGGTSKCSTGGITTNLLNYNMDNASADATDLYTKLQTWLAAHPGPQRNVMVASHSWGGAVGEYLAEQRETIESANGPLANATLAFTVAMGVPGFVLGYTYKGPGLRELGDRYEYEVDRPDDPVHALHPGGNGGGHQYDIVVAGTFLGSYGITTEQLACDGVAGACANP